MIQAFCKGRVTGLVVLFHFHTLSWTLQKVQFLKGSGIFPEVYFLVIIYLCLCALVPDQQREVLYFLLFRIVIRTQMLPCLYIFFHLKLILLPLYNSFLFFIFIFFSPSPHISISISISQYLKRK